MPDGDLVQALESLALWQVHVDEFGVHGFDVGQDQQLFDVGVVAYVAVQRRVGVAPLFRGLTEEGDVEQVGLA